MLSNIQNTSLLPNKCYINGEWLSSEKTFTVTNPATLDIIASIPSCSASDTEKAINDANVAFATWRSHTARTRSDFLMRWYQLILDNADDLATIMTTEQGKPLTEAKGEITYAANFLRWFAEEGVRAYGDLIPTHNVNARILVNKKPIGVVGIITPWNFPVAMITRKIAPALAAGCTCVIKPSSLTPLSAIAIVKLAEDAGIPKGVINIVCGDSSVISNVMTKSDIVRKISFTGSTKVGQLLMEKSAPTLKKLSLELGGNAPFIVFSDANLDTAVDAAMICKFRNTGQTCVCANRFYVHEDVAEVFAQKLSQKVKKLHTSNGFEEGATQGPLISQNALEKVEEHISDAVAKGAEIIVGGKRHHNGKLFFEPTILKNVSADALINNEETFGPVAPIITFKTDDEVIAKANNTEFGLAAYFCTQNLTRAFLVSEALDCGIVGVNEGIISTEVAPFGGVKQSGLGREGSKYGLDEYLECQYVLMGIKDRIY